MIKQYLKEMIELQRSYKRNFETKYISIYDFILKNGQECKPQPFNEELYILDQYYELGMKLPDENSEFMQKAEKAKQEIKRKKQHNYE